MADEIPITQQSPMADLLDNLDEFDDVIDPDFFMDDSQCSSDEEQLLLLLPRQPGNDEKVIIFI